MYRERSLGLEQRPGGAQLYNGAGLPAAPFHADSFKR